MTPFALLRAESERQAVDAVATHPGARFIAGGTDILPLWKTGAAVPPLLVDIGALPLAAVTESERGLSIGALARLSDVAAAPSLHGTRAAVAQAIAASASTQVRNMATVGGNLLQRTRCAYFRDPTLPCNRREPGSGCGAIAGEHRSQAIFGGSEHCVATHASDLAVALVALDACVRARGPQGERTLALEALYRQPGDHPQHETILAPGELLVGVELPPATERRRSLYLKLRDRASFEFALVSVAVALGVERDRGGAARLRDVRLAAGGVGTVPWRLRGCERVLEGAAAGSEVIARAALASGEHARPLPGNAFKLDLLARSVQRALQQVLEDVLPDVPAASPKES